MTIRNTDAVDKPISVPAWLGTIAIALVPLVNVAVFLYWSFGANVNPNRRNFSRAALIMIAVVTALAVLIFFHMLLCIDPHERIKAFMMVE
jgi:phosphatidylglycerophosphate synthase